MMMSGVRDSLLLLHYSIGTIIRYITIINGSVESEKETYIAWADLERCERYTCE